MPTAEEILREFASDVEAAFADKDHHGDPMAPIDPEQVAESLAGDGDWSDLAETYRKAKAFLAHDSRMRYDSQNPLRIRRVVSAGELEIDNAKNIRSVLVAMGNALGNTCADEIFGDAVFEAEDGVTYIALVEGCLVEINPEKLQELREEQAENQDHEPEA